MKKNDVMGYIVYALMLGGAVGVGFGVIRPILNETPRTDLPMEGILLILLSVLVGAVLSADIIIAILMAYAKLPYSNFLFLIPVASNIVIGIVSDVRARLAVDKLKLITDQKIRCVRNGEEIDIETEQIVLHDIVIYKTGDQIATDGVLIEGSASIDESLVTGEAEKINKVPGDKILSGTVVVSGKVYVRVTSIGIANYAEGLQDEAKKFNRPSPENFYSLPQKSLKMLNEADLILVPSLSAKNLLFQCGFQSQNIEILTPGVNIARFEEIDPLEAQIFSRYFKLPKEAKYAMSVGDLDDKKSRCHQD